jgi:hypothetical protein
MAARSSVDSKSGMVGAAKDSVVSLVSSLFDKPETSGQEDERRRPQLSAITSEDDANAVSTLPGGFTVVELRTERALFSEFEHWQHRDQVSQWARSRGNRFMSVRGPDERAVLMVELDPVGMIVERIRFLRSDADIFPFAPHLGRHLVGSGYDLGRYSGLLGLVRDRNKTSLFMDDVPDRLDLDSPTRIQMSGPFAMPKVIVSTSHFEAGDCRMTRCAVSISVEGNLGLSGCRNLDLPSHLHVGRDLYIQLSDAQKLPDRFHVGRDIDLAHTPVEAFPDHFFVGRHIRANHSAIKEIKGGFTTRGDLDLRRSSLEKLSWGLEVNGHLDVTGTSLIAIPGDAVIHGDLKIDEDVVLPSTVRIGGRLLYGRPYGFETATSRS